MRSRSTISFSALLLLCFTVSVASVRHLDGLRPTATLQEVLYISSPKIIKRVSLGYDGFVADIYWTRAVQYFGSKHNVNAMEYKLLYPLLNITTQLDPHLIPAYDFGSMFLAQKPPQGAGSPQQAIQLLQSGIAANPNEWRLYQDMGFVEYMEMKDYKAAGYAFARGAQIPGAHPFLKVMAAKSLEKGGSIETSRMLWQSMYESTNDKTMQANAIKHLRALQVDGDVPVLEQMIQTYRQRTGHLPASFVDLVAAGFLRQIPRDPLGYPYQLGPDGRVQVRSSAELPFITQGLPPGEKPSEFDIPGLKKK